MLFISPNQQRQSAEGKRLTVNCETCDSSLDYTDLLLAYKQPQSTDVQIVHLSFPSSKQVNYDVLINCLHITHNRTNELMPSL